MKSTAVADKSVSSPKTRASARPTKAGLSEREEWIAEIEEITSQIELWSKEQGWLTHRQEVRINEASMGSYGLPAIFITAPEGRLTVEPVGKDICGAEGRIDLLSFPAEARLKLIRKNGKWRVEDDWGRNVSTGWGRKQFLKFATALIQARWEPEAGYQ